MGGAMNRKWGSNDPERHPAGTRAVTPAIFLIQCHLAKRIPHPARNPVLDSSQKGKPQPAQSN
jgi:hypothetical protein